MPPGRGAIIEGRGRKRGIGVTDDESEEVDGERAKEVDLERSNLKREIGGNIIGGGISRSLHKDGLRRRSRHLMARQDDTNVSLAISGSQTFNVVVVSETYFTTVNPNVATAPVGFPSSQQFLSSPTPPPSPSDSVPSSSFPTPSITPVGYPKTTIAVPTPSTIATPIAGTTVAENASNKPSSSISTTVTSYLTPSSTGRPRNTTTTKISEYRMTKSLYQLLISFSIFNDN